MINFKVRWYLLHDLTCKLLVGVVRYNHCMQIGSILNLAISGGGGIEERRCRINVDLNLPFSQVS